MIVAGGGCLWCQQQKEKVVQMCVEVASSQITQFPREMSRAEEFAIVEMRRWGGDDGDHGGEDENEEEDWCCCGSPSKSGN